MLHLVSLKDLINENEKRMNEMQSRLVKAMSESAAIGRFSCFQKQFFNGVQKVISKLGQQALKFSFIFSLDVMQKKKIAGTGKYDVV